MWSRLCVIAALLCPAVAAKAATIETTASSLEGKPFTFITVRGELVSGDEDRFADVVIGVKAGAVVFDGPGGNLIAGIEIGKAIRIKGLTTLVAPDEICASACALAWLGGQARFMASDARVGFHAASITGDPKHAHAVGNAFVGAYLNQLGLPLSAIAYITEAPPSDIRWLTIEDASRNGIDVKLLDADDPAMARLLPGEAPREDWTRLGEWIQLFSRQHPAVATALAVDKDSRLGNAAVFRADNGWYSVVLGPYPRGTARAERERLLAAGLIPGDSLVVQGKGFVALVWGDLPEPRAEASHTRRPGG